MTEWEIEEVLGLMGTRQIAQLQDEVRGPLLILGEEAIAPLVRVLQDADFREHLWETYGCAYEGEPILQFGEGVSLPFTIPTLDHRQFVRLLRAGAIYILLHRRESQTEPLSSILHAARIEADKDEAPQIPERKVGPKQRRWLKFLDDCANWDLEGVRAFFAQLKDERQGSWIPSRAEAAQSGWFFAFRDGFGGKEMTPQEKEVLEFFLSHGANIEETLNANMTQTPLHRASQQNDVERLRWLVEHGANVHAFDGDGWTPLMLAANGDGLIGQRDLEKMKAALTFLLEHGALIEEREDADSEFSDFAAPPIWEVADEDARAFLHVWRAREDATGEENEVE